VEALQLVEETTNAREVASSLVPQFKHISQADSDRLLRALLNNLASGEITGRLAAGEALAAWDKVSAIPDREKAISIETDENTRSSLQADLTGLLKQQRSAR
jgi:hypothetical protein